MQQRLDNSGKFINLDKSGMAFCPKMDNHMKNQMVSTLNIKILGPNDKYLWVPISIQQNKVETFGYLPKKFQYRFASWRGKNMNQPTRTIMLQSTIGSLTSHYLVVSHAQKTYK